MVINQDLRTISFLSLYWYTSNATSYREYVHCKFNIPPVDIRRTFSVLSPSSPSPLAPFFSTASFSLKGLHSTKSSSECFFLCKEYKFCLFMFLFSHYCSFNRLFLYLLRLLSFSACHTSLYAIFEARIH